MNKYAIYLLLLAFVFSSCVQKNALYKVPEYRQLLMYSQMPKEVFGYANDGAFMQFQRFERAIKDTVVIVKFDSKGYFRFAGGLEIDEEFVRHKFMDIVYINGDAFFTYNYRNMGNSNNNLVRMYYIASDCSLHQVEVVRADSLYAATLPDNQFVWNGEEIDFTQVPVTSQFYVWNKADIHPLPTVGKVSVVYQLRKTGKTKYTLYPEDINFTKGSFNLSE
ncbi:hypothetical protein [Bacteroides reticulotermitis]|nr:hypothetical protein [Bacteroides reticulotermitis]MBB4045888.1 hypothetical protein [Bacteroides reticulotermitis]